MKNNIAIKICRIAFYFVLGVILMSIFGCNKKSKEEAFWDWFIENSDEIVQARKTDEIIIQKMSNELKKVNPGLVYEMSAVEIGGKIEFTISADGMKDVVDAVIKLYDKRPELQKFEVKAFRQRNKQIFDLSYRDIEIKGKETKYLLLKDDEPKKIGILLFFENFSEDKRQEFGHAGFLFLDSILGEYDVITKVGIFDVFGTNSKYFQDAKNVEYLAEDFDSYYVSE